MPASRRKIHIVTFNENEAMAVDTLLTRMEGSPGSPWSWRPIPGHTRAGPEIWAHESPEVTIRHVPLSAQGNIIVAARLAALFKDQDPPDFVVFYGCAGVADPSLVGSAFLVERVNYMSLGTVQSCTCTLHERVTVKNKWLCHTIPSEVAPLEPVDFDLSAGTSALSLPSAVRIGTAHVVATDKVIRVAPSTAGPTPQVAAAPHNRFAKGEWSYAEGLAYMAASLGPASPMLIDMESYGIASIASSLEITSQVAILRVATDDLVGHANSDANQKALLLQGINVLGRVLLALIRGGS